MLSPTSFLYEVREGVAYITLNRPERLNALTFEVYRELTDTFAALRSETEVRAVVITGAGRAFCSGGDVRDIIGELQGRDIQGLLEFTRLTCELVRNIRLLRKPVIASLNGRLHHGRGGAPHRPLQPRRARRGAGGRDALARRSSGARPRLRALDDE